MIRQKPLAEADRAGNLQASNRSVRQVKGGVSPNQMGYPQHVTEVYQLTLNENGRGTLIWSNIKNRSGPLGITRGAVFTTTCNR